MKHREKDLARRFCPVYFPFFFFFFVLYIYHFFLCINMTETESTLSVIKISDFRKSIQFLVDLNWLKKSAQHYINH